MELSARGLKKILENHFESKGFKVCYYDTLNGDSSRHLTKIGIVELKEKKPKSTKSCLAVVAVLNGDQRAKRANSTFNVELKLLIKNLLGREPTFEDLAKIEKGA